MDLLKIKQELQYEYEKLFHKTYSKRNFEEVFGFDIDTLGNIYIKPEIYSNIALSPDFLLYFYFIKVGNWIINPFGIKSQKTFMKKFWFICEIFYQKLHEINMNLYLNQKMPETFKNALLIVDTTPFEVPQPINLLKKFSLWSEHYKIYCYKYLFLVNRENGLICYCSNAHNGNEHDLQIYKNENINELLPSNTLVIGDRIFYSLYDEICKKIIIGYRNPKNEFEKKFNYNYRKCF